MKLNISIFVLAALASKAVASSCEANLGSKLSEGTDDLGSNANEIYPNIHNGAWRRADDSVAVLVGRNYYGVSGAEIEGKIVCLGDFEIQGNGPGDLVEAGVGSRVVPNDGDVILVGNDLKIKKKVRVMELGGKGVGNIVYGGNYNSNQGTIDSFGTVTKNPNLDLTYFVSALDDLREKSAYWASLPPNGKSASYQWGWQFSKGNNECVQVMNVEASKLGGGNWVNFHSSLASKTIIINVVDTGAVTIDRVQDMVDPTGNRGYAFSPAVTKNILWNFPHATSVTLNGGAEFQGSILIPNGDLIFRHPGHSGRVIVAGDLTQNYGGSEFHNYQFDPICPLPLSECKEPTMAPTEAPTTTAPTKSPTKAPTTTAPTKSPTKAPTTTAPTKSPTRAPTTTAPTKSPTKAPTTTAPTKSPTRAPTTTAPTKSPTRAPTTTAPTKSPTRAPTTTAPTKNPTKAPTTTAPSKSPTKAPTTTAPTKSPTKAPTTTAPTKSPTKAPTTTAPTKSPTKEPIKDPNPTVAPTTTISDSSANGDPHFKTWKHEHFEFHGQCDMILAKDPKFANGVGLDVQIRTKLVRFWSYIRSAAIRIGDDILEIQGSIGDMDRHTHYWVNFQYQADTTNVGGFPLTITSNGAHKRYFEINLDSKFPGQKIVLSAFKEFVAVDFKGGTVESFGNMVGMLGDYQSGKTFARDGVAEINDFNELGNEWQLLPSDDMLFHDKAEPQYPKRCILPEDPQGQRHRRLDESSISVEKAETICATLKDPLIIKDCVYDILATQDLDMVGAF